MFVEDMATITSIHNTESALKNLNERLKTDFRFEISIDGFQALHDDLVDVALEFDVSTIYDLNKSTLLWHKYLVESIALLDMALDQYKNIVDIYNYLSSISVLNVEEFVMTAPKYKIDTTNVPYAIKIVEKKLSEFTTLTKNIKSIIAKLTSYDKFIVSGYYKTSRVIRSISRREKNISFIG